MASVPSLASNVQQRLANALSAALPEAGSADPLLRRSDRADFQANGILALAKQLKGNPRELAAKVVDALGTESDEVLREVEVSGPGFLNITVSDAAIIGTLAARAADDRLGVALTADPGTTVIDWAQPNVAKEMHVGHLRSAVIGAAMVNILEFTGEKVISRHHIGDWGTQFGMLIQYLEEHPHELDHREGSEVSGEEAMSSLDRLYKAARAHFDSDEEFKARSRDRVVALQSGDPATLAMWQRFVDESKIYFNSVFEKLDMEIADEDIVGESGYNDMLAETCRLLEESGVAVRSDGALCVFFDDIKGPDGEPTPLIVQKSNGGFGYAATDLSAIRDRVGKLGARNLIYVVDVRQSMHFKMVFETARRAGWLTDEVRAVQLAFGTVLGADGKPFKTREGKTVKLVDLLDEAVDRATAVVREKAEKVGLGEEEIVENGRYVGIGAIKYADLSTSAVRDYKFDLDQMVSLNGDTSVYLQYAYARIRSILRKAGDAKPAAHPELELHPAERALALHVDLFGEVVAEVAGTYEPHKLAAYLYQLASHLTTFYDKCQVLSSENAPELVENRLFLVELTGRTLQQGMALLGIRTPERL
ncbi:MULTISPECIES: arginine--tRNA ligase [Streptomyces]|uniref:Arginine--tRNA ligase n=1 Tax=Streptomyces tsukubensis (strain DSM 42081 / NBRC 108919 / NRRL 18488 / 9993) TaxID=1114943 RepID=I2N3V2_STRT9|nr:MULTISPECIES: arginine--tRNA ligase [Streptomyces]AZK95788.1 arginine--tRNA ligase [Streptomyces tsukubensis]EIF91699.1 arginyl-tRNA synthetase [Streptomyces tsukubensis NRRL18488]MYS65644.1 arginine--tRNA ligase [Streptomyces sp. SID5473]QKM68187.1 arginine--tRNA ligase [Streptomyces tsukubensis NRRL18488]TAI44588.1 arginine--tRNA ligase [Streptomyces tsukubensis]